jgi:glycosyltransferase 2 family protein
LIKKAIQVFIGLGLGALLIWVLFRETSWTELSVSLRKASPFWLLMSQVPIWGSFFARARRWSYIVRASEQASFRSVFSSTSIGMMVNFLLPLRAGEFVRAYLLARFERFPFSKGIALATLDRVADLAGVIAVALVAMAALQGAGDVAIPPDAFGTSEPLVISERIIQISAGTASALLAVMVAALVLLYAKQDLAVRLAVRVVGTLSKRLAALAGTMLGHFAQGLHIFRSASDMAKTVLFTLVTWLCFVLSVFCFLKAFHIECPWYALFVIQTFVALAVSLPAAPGFIGQFHFAVVASLLLAAPSANATDAKALAITAHLLNMAPVLIAGLFCWFLEDLTLGDLKTAKPEPGATSLKDRPRLREKAAAVRRE